MSNLTIEVKNDDMLGRRYDGVVATKLYSLEKQIEEKDKEIERLNNIINELDKLISIKIIREANKEDYHIDVNDVVEIKMKLLELKGDDK